MIREYLIQKELDSLRLYDSSDFRYVRLSSRFLDRLFRNYCIDEIRVDYYYGAELDPCGTDIYANGIWCQSQSEVDALAKTILKSFRRKSVSDKGRVYFLKDGKRDEMIIYYYGQDLEEYENANYWFYLKKR